jgi:hypothetical protein
MRCCRVRRSLRLVYCVAGHRRALPRRQPSLQCARFSIVANSQLAPAHPHWQWTGLPVARPLLATVARVHGEAPGSWWPLRSPARPEDVARSGTPSHATVVVGCPRPRVHAQPRAEDEARTVRMRRRLERAAGTVRRPGRAAGCSVARAAGGAECAVASTLAAARSDGNGNGAIAAARLVLAALQWG